MSTMSMGKRVEKIPALSEETDDIHPQEDGSYIIDGTATVREINKALNWDLPIDGPKNPEWTSY